MIRRPPRSPLFPYPPLFRSHQLGGATVLNERPAAHLIRGPQRQQAVGDRKSTRLNSSHTVISYAVFCLKKKNKIEEFKCLAMLILGMALIASLTHASTRVAS